MMMMLGVVIRTEVWTQRCGTVMIKSREAMHMVGTRHTAHVFKVCKMSLSGISLAYMNERFHHFDGTSFSHNGDEDAEEVEDEAEREAREFVQENSRSCVRS